MQPDFDSRGVTRPLSAFLRLAMLGCPARRARCAVRLFYLKESHRARAPVLTRLRGLACPGVPRSRKAPSLGPWRGWPHNNGECESSMVCTCRLSHITLASQVRHLHLGKHCMVSLDLHKYR